MGAPIRNTFKIGNSMYLYWKIFEKSGEKDTPFFEIFPKEIHRIANFESVSYRDPHQNHLFFPSVSYNPHVLLYVTVIIYNLYRFVGFTKFYSKKFVIFVTKNFTLNIINSSHRFRK